MRIPGWFYGILLCVLGQFMATSGLAMIKKSSQEEGHKPWYKRRFLATGMAFIIFNGSVVDLFAYTLAPLSLIAPFAALTIVFSNFLAGFGWLVEKEGISNLSILANLIIIVGIVLTCFYGPHGSDDLSINEMAHNAAHIDFVAFAIPCASTILLYMIIRFALKSHPTLKVIWCGLAGACAAALSQMCLKAVGELLAVSFAGHNQFGYPSTYAPILGMLVFAPLNAHLLNSTLANAPTTLGIPLYQSLLVITTICAGGTFFQEFRQFPSFLNVLFFGVGVAMTVLGLMMLAYDKHGFPRHASQELAREVVLRKTMSTISDYGSGRLSGLGEPLLVGDP